MDIVASACHDTICRFASLNGFHDQRIVQYSFLVLSAFEIIPLTLQISEVDRDMGLSARSWHNYYLNLN